MDVEIRLASKSDAKRCNDFHNQYYSAARRIDQWRWVFDHPLSGHQIPFTIAEEAGDIVGTQALIPIRFIGHLGVFLTAKSEETLVAERMRGKSVFERMYEPLLELASKHSIGFIWGFTPATKAFRRMGFHIPGKTSQLFMPLSYNAWRAFGARLNPTRNWLKTLTLSFLSLSAGAFSRVLYHSRFSRRIAGLSVRELQAAPNEAGLVSRRFIQQWGGVTLLRDRDYLQWRLFDNPHRKITFQAAYIEGELAGWVAYTMGPENVGYIIDVFVAPAEESRDSVAAIVAHLCEVAIADFMRKRASSIRAWHINNHGFDRIVKQALQRAGFLLFKEAGESIVIKYMKEDSPMQDFNTWYVSRIYTEGSLG